MPTADPLSNKEIADRLAELPGWELSADGAALVRTYRLAHLPAAIFAVHIAQVQNELDHHSDLTLGYNTLGVAITTHSAGGRLTWKDFGLAARIAALAPAHGAE
ncbi:4a-hydroxytetrahydrobiopterin dehydratase [Streptomyces sp. H10-C2]|uniref:4a-hydroxytetrahydrobiopterin dehydratase n=1 Tax=unclassified Streptomyces TaxID=2593676 RepID=UPI0024B8F348|nr:MULTISPECIES: 4a-hydroxytetrahydrobiopterin dehydratase [unclassified Streptomyces]MDJ0346568.1 4a-hydroxytetrahydrobiopterin dehydratase [Streptomyces sp. PH10-H1]MDJ0374188.1 4a-hydroxytetrahydrobiopterin dehydratase [Streptomyces sp. H10-C2]